MTYSYVVIIKMTAEVLVETQRQGNGAEGNCKQQCRHQSHWNDSRGTGWRKRNLRRWGQFWGLQTKTHHLYVSPCPCVIVSMCHRVYVSSCLCVTVSIIHRVRFRVRPELGLGQGQGRVRVKHRIGPTHRHDDTQTRWHIETMTHGHGDTYR